jgi:hypothetical protein
MKERAGKNLRNPQLIMKAMRQRKKTDIKKRELAHEEK